jgi:hypothetical protein
MSELSEIKNEFEDLQRRYENELPKVDPDLIHDLLIHLHENPGTTPIFMVEVFTKNGIDSQKARDFIFHKTGVMPAIYDNGTHYVTNRKLTLEALKEISDDEDVLEVSVEYTGSIGGYGAFHEQHSDHRHVHDYY